MPPITALSKTVSVSHAISRVCMRRAASKAVGLHTATRPTRRLVCQAAHGEDDPTSSPGPDASAGAGVGPSSGRAFSLPARAVPTAGAVFLLAGLMKLIIMCFPFSSMSIMMYLTGRADLGVWAVAKMLPIALGLAALAKVVLDRKLQTKVWVQRGILLGGVAALLLSRWAFARPKPSPLDAMFQAAAQQQAAVAYEREQRMAAHAGGTSSHLLRPPSEEARKELEARSKDPDPPARQ